MLNLQDMMMPSFYRTDDKIVDRHRWYSVVSIAKIKLHMPGRCNLPISGFGHVHREYRNWKCKNAKDLPSKTIGHGM